MDPDSIIKKIYYPMTLVSFMLLLVTFMYEKNLYSLFTYPLYSILFSILFFLFGLFIHMINSIAEFDKELKKNLNYISIAFYLIGIVGFVIAISFLIRSVQ